MARPKKPTAVIENVEQADAAMLSMLQAEVELEKMVGAADLARAAATAKYESGINTNKARIADLTVQLQTFYMGHRAELEHDGRKSAQMTYGIIGSRTGNPTLKPLNRAWTWGAIAVKLRETYKGKFFHQVDPEIDRDLVKASLSGEQLGEVGLKIEQEERFFVELDRSKLGETA